MQALIDKMIQIRAVGDLIGFIVGGIALLIFIGWVVFQVIKRKKKKERDILSPNRGNND